MGATVIVNSTDNLVWMPNSYNFRQTIQYLIDELNIQHASISQELEEYRDDPLSYIDMSEWEAQKMNTFLKGVLLAEQKLNTQWVNFANPPLRLSVIQSLKIQLYFDDRIFQTRHRSELGIIIVGSNRLWKKMQWIYDFSITIILETIISLMIDERVPRNEDLIKLINMAKSHKNFNMTTLSDKEQKILVAGIDDLDRFYNVEPIGYDLYPEKIKTFLQPAIAELCSMYKQIYPNIISYWNTEEG